MFPKKKTVFLNKTVLKPGGYSITHNEFAINKNSLLQQCNIANNECVMSYRIKPLVLKPLSKKPGFLTSLHGMSFDEQNSTEVVEPTLNLYGDCFKNNLINNSLSVTNSNESLDKRLQASLRKNWNYTLFKKISSKL
jgi:hypothetical protein